MLLVVDSSADNVIRVKCGATESLSELVFNNGDLITPTPSENHLEVLVSRYNWRKKTFNHGWKKVLQGALNSFAKTYGFEVIDQNRVLEI